MTRRPPLAILLAAALIAAAPLGAQQIPERLSLEDAIRIAEANNPDYRGVLADVEVAEAETRRSRGAFLPRLEATAGVSATSSRILVGEDNFGRPLAADSAITFTNSFASQRALLSLPLFEGGTRFSELGAARAEERSAVATGEARAVRLRADVERQYYAALREQRLIELEERLLANARERLDATRRLLRVVANDPVDVLGAEVEVAQQELAIARAVGEARKAKLALQETMGAGGDAAFVLTSDAPAIADPAELEVDRLVARAVESHPRVRQAEFGAEAADRRVEAAARQRWPTLSADVGVGRSVNAADYGAFGDFLTPSDRSLSFGFSGRLPIFNGLQTSAAVSRARANRTRAEEAVRAARLEVEREVRSAWIDLEVAYAAVQLAERASALASERLELAQEKYRFGGVSFTDLQLVIDGAARTERQEIAARFEYATALATLEEKVAGPIRP